MKARPSKLDIHTVRLTEWFAVEHITLKEAQERLRQDGCTISATSLSEWWSRRQEQLMRDQLLTRIATGSELNKQITAEYAKHPAPELETLIKLIKTLILQMATGASSSPALLEMVPGLMRQVLDSRKLDVKQEEVSLAREKFEFDAAGRCLAHLEELKSIKGSHMTDPQKIDAIRRRLFGALPEEVAT